VLQPLSHSDVTTDVYLGWYNRSCHSFVNQFINQFVNQFVNQFPNHFVNIPRKNGKTAKRGKIPAVLSTCHRKEAEVNLMAQAVAANSGMGDIISDIGRACIAVQVDRLAKVTVCSSHSMHTTLVVK
jgi:hypothetical protein